MATSYVISYKGNSNTGGSTSSQTKYYGVSLTLRSNGFTRTGYAFKRWNTKADDSGTAYKAGASYTGNAALTLYAIWNRTVTFNANGGSGAPPAQTAVSTSAIALSSSIPARSGCIFSHWNTAKDGSGTSYEPGASYAKNKPSVTLYAIWLPITLALTRVDGDGIADEMGGFIACSASWSVQPSKAGASMAFSCGSATETVSLSGASGTAAATLDASARADTPCTVTATLTDSAGRTGSKAAASSTAYTKPVVTSVLCVRVGEDGELADDGTRMKCVVGWRVAAVGSQRKPFALDVVASHGGTRVDGASAEAFDAAVSGAYATGVTTLELDGPFGTDERYGVSVTLSDRINSVTVGDVLTEAYFPFDLLRGGGHGLAVGKPATQADLLDVGYDLNVDGGASLNGLSLHGAPALPTYEIAAAWSGDQAAFAALLPHRPCIALSADGYELWFDGDPATDTY